MHFDFQGIIQDALQFYNNANAKQFCSFSIKQWVIKTDNQ